MSDTANIAEYIELNPHVPGLAEARLKGYGVAVWALIGHLPAVKGDLAGVARDYGVPLEAVEAAVAYYQRYRVLIDARIAANTPDLDAILSPV
ncbi:MAG TPA: hypothetical protein VLA19_23795 [Herpetosiphonaceae bacterium]|nr:hypothetical protein [Herpetosiphonaceae bacterium]